MLGDIAQNYVRVRTDQEQIKTQQANVELQRGVLRLHREATERRLSTNRVGLRPGPEQREADRGRHPDAGDRSAAGRGRPLRLVGHAAGRIWRSCWAWGQSRSTPPEVAIGIPADLLRRRPDVRQAERSGGRPRPSRSASPRPPCIPPSTSTARWVTRPKTSRICSEPRRSTAASVRRFNGTC